MSKVYHIQVTQADIDVAVKQRAEAKEGQGSYKVCLDCAIAKAVSRTLQREIAWGYRYGSDPGLPLAGATCGAVHGDRAKTAAFVSQFDQTEWDDDVEVPGPFEFDLIYDSRGLF